jgi:tetraacyldisaccharide 4'-kinase
LNPLSTIYGTVVWTRGALYDRGVLPARRLQGPVVSVGSISVGGAGKTPFVILLGELLKARDVKFDVLSRGYGRQSRGVLLVDPGGLPQQFGDEPLLMARKLQVPVIVGEDRYAAGLFAESRFGRWLSAPWIGAGFRHCCRHPAGCERSVAAIRPLARAS